MEIEPRAAKAYAQVSKPPSNITKSGKRIKPESVQQTSTEQRNDSLSFWTPASKEISKRWLLDPNVEPVNADFESLDPSSRNLVRGSWFNAEISNLLPKDGSLPPKNKNSACLWEEIVDQQQLREAAKGKPKKIKKPSPISANRKKKKEPAGKTRKIRIFPDTQQKETLIRWFGGARQTYNLCLAKFKEQNKGKLLSMKSFDQKGLYTEFVNKKTLKNNPELSYLIQTPNEVREGAFYDLRKNLFSIFAKDAGPNFELKYRTRKGSQSILIRHRVANFKRGFYKFIPQLRASQPIGKINHDSRIILDKRGHFYFCIPVPLDRRSENQAPSCQGTAGVIALDPGVRKFMTGFDAAGRVVMIGNKDRFRLKRLWYKFDKLNSKLSQSDIKHKKRYRLKRAAQRAISKARHLVDEVHKKLCQWLCKNYRIVLIPIFPVQTMVTKKTDNDSKKINRKISGKTAHSMLIWAHYRFRERLLFKAKEYPWCKVLVVSESFTSQTCGKCGTLNKNLYGSEVFICPSSKCRWTIDRDINGARNVLLKFLTEIEEEI